MSVHAPSDFMPSRPPTSPLPPLPRHPSPPSAAPSIAVTNTAAFQDCLDGLSQTRQIQSRHDTLVNTLQSTLAQRQRERSRSSSSSPRSSEGPALRAVARAEGEARSRLLFGRRVAGLVEELLEGTAAVTEYYRIGVLDPLQCVTDNFRAYWQVGGAVGDNTHGSSRARPTSSPSPSPSPSSPPPATTTGASRSTSALREKSKDAYDIYPYSESAAQCGSSQRFPYPSQSAGPQQPPQSPATNFSKKEPQDEKEKETASQAQSGSPMRRAFARTMQLSAQLDELLHLQHEALLSIQAIVLQPQPPEAEDPDSALEATLSRYAEELSDLSGSTQHLLRCLEDELTALCDPNPYRDAETFEEASSAGATAAGGASVVVSSPLCLRERSPSLINVSPIGVTPSPTRPKAVPETAGRASASPSKSHPRERSGSRRDASGVERQSSADATKRAKPLSPYRSLVSSSPAKGQGMREDKENQDRVLSPRAEDGPSPLSPTVLVSPPSEARAEKERASGGRATDSRRVNAAAAFARHRSTPVSSPSPTPTSALPSPAPADPFPEVGQHDNNPVTKSTEQRVREEVREPSLEARALMPELLGALGSAVNTTTSPLSQQEQQQQPRTSRERSERFVLHKEVPAAFGAQHMADCSTSSSSSSGDHEERSPARSPRSPFASSPVRRRIEESPPDEPPPQVTGSLMRQTVAANGSTTRQMYQTPRLTASTSSSPTSSSEGTEEGESVVDNAPYPDLGNASFPIESSESEEEEEEEENEGAMFGNRVSASMEKGDAPPSSTEPSQHEVSITEPRPADPRNALIASLRAQVSQLTLSNASSGSRTPLQESLDGAKPAARVAGHRRADEQGLPQRPPRPSVASAPTAAAASRGSSVDRRSEGTQTSMDDTLLRHASVDTQELARGDHLGGSHASSPLFSAPLTQHVFQQQWLWQQEQQRVQAMEEQHVRLLTELQQKVDYLKAEQHKIAEKMEEGSPSGDQHIGGGRTRRMKSKGRRKPIYHKQTVSDRDSDSSESTTSNDSHVAFRTKEDASGTNGHAANAPDDAVGFYRKRQQARQEQRWRKLVEDLETETQVAQEQLEEEKARCARLQADNVRLKKHLAEVEGRLSRRDPSGAEGSLERRGSTTTNSAADAAASAMRRLMEHEALISQPPSSRPSTSGISVNAAPATGATERHSAPSSRTVSRHSQDAVNDSVTSGHRRISTFKATNAPFSADFTVTSASLSPMQEKRLALLQRLKTSAAAESPSPHPPPAASLGDARSPPPPCAVNDTTVVVSPMSDKGRLEDDSMGESPGSVHEDSDDDEWHTRRRRAIEASNTRARGMEEYAALEVRADNEEDEDMQQLSDAQRVIANAKRLLAKVKLADASHHKDSYQEAKVEEEPRGRGSGSRSSHSLSLSPPPPFPHHDNGLAQTRTLRQGALFESLVDGDEPEGGTPTVHAWSPAVELDPAADVLPPHERSFYQDRRRGTDAELLLGLSPCAAVSYSSSKQPRKTYASPPPPPPYADQPPPLQKRPQHARSTLDGSPWTDGGTSPIPHAPQAAQTLMAVPADLSARLFDPLRRQRTPSGSMRGTPAMDGTRDSRAVVDASTSPIRIIVPTPAPAAATTTDPQGWQETQARSERSRSAGRRERTVTIVSPGHTPQRPTTAQRPRAATSPILLSSSSSARQRNGSREDASSRPLRSHAAAPQSARAFSDHEGSADELQAQYTALQAQRSDIVAKARELHEKKRELAAALAEERDELLRYRAMSHQGGAAAATPHEAAAREEGERFHKRRAQLLVQLMRKLQHAEAVLEARGLETEEKLHDMHEHLHMRKW